MQNFILEAQVGLQNVNLAQLFLCFIFLVSPIKFIETLFFKIDLDRKNVMTELPHTQFPLLTSFNGLF